MSENDLKSAYSQKILSQSAESLKLQFPGLTEEEIETLTNIKSEAGTETSSESGSNATDKFPGKWEESTETLEELITEMNEADKLVLLEMNKAHENSSFLSNTQTRLKNLPSNSTEMFNIADGFVRRIIKVAKQLEFFRAVNKDDQIALLKGSIVEIMMLRSAVNFDINKETWTLNTASCISKTGSSSSSETSSSVGSPPGNPSPGAGLDIESLRKMARGGMDLSKVIPGLPPNMNIDQLRSLGAKFGFCPPPSEENRETDPEPSTSESSSISASVLKMGNSETRTMFLTYSKFIKSLMTTIGGDLVILKFMIMMSLFSPDRPGLEDTDSIQKYQEVYANVLQNYIHVRYPDRKNMFAKSIMKLTDLRNINEVHTKMLLKMQITDIEPLLIEIFDLSS